MKKITTEEFITKAEIRYNHTYNYDYSVVDNGVLSRVRILCPKHGFFEKRVFSHLNGEGCPKCSFYNRKRNVLDLIAQAESIHGVGTYDYSMINDDVRYTKDNVDIICPTHGTFNTSLKNHIMCKSGCPSCYVERTKAQIHPKQQNICADSLNLLDTRSWLETQNRDNNLTLTEIASELGVSVSTVWARFQKYGIPTKHFKTSLQEQEIADFVRELDPTIKTNVRNLIHPYEIDIVSYSHNLCIEYNGNIWHSEQFGGKNKSYHEHKRLLCERAGFTLIQILESEWLYNKQIVQSRIKQLFKSQTAKIYARNCKVLELDHYNSKMFFNETHLQGNGRALVTYGLYVDDELVSAMSFCRSRFNSNISYELLRFSSKLNTSVVGGAGKLLNVFIKKYNPRSIISYADKRWSAGNLYKQLGFKHTHDSSPNYKYFKCNNALVLYSRQKFQKHKLKNILEFVDENATEWENMKNNNYDRIWDCGNMVWILEVEH
jgi:very-short-patch-repair endonuclease